MACANKLLYVVNREFVSHVMSVIMVEISIEVLQMEILGFQKESIFLLLRCSRENAREHNSVRLKKASGNFIGRLVFTNVTSELLHSKRYYRIERLFALVDAQPSLNSLEKKPLCSIVQTPS